MDCFLVLNVSYSELNSSQIALNFINNVAGEDGSVLYGGRFDRCALLFGEISQSDSGSECTCTNNSGLEYCRDSFAILNSISMFERNENSTAIFSSSAEKNFVFAMARSLHVSRICPSLPNKLCLGRSLQWQW